MSLLDVMRHRGKTADVSKALASIESTYPTRTVAERGADRSFLSLTKADVVKTQQTFKLGTKVPSDLRLRTIAALLKELGPTWYGVKCAEEMRESGDPNWRQTEWMGWYFESVTSRRLSRQLMMYRNFADAKKAIFDAYCGCPVDLKVHAVFKTDGTPNKDVLLNDRDAIQNALVTEGKIAFIVVEGVADTTCDDYQQWHETNASVMRRAPAKPRKFKRARKNSFQLESIKLFVITRADAEQLWRSGVLALYNQGTQASGARRAPKLSLDLTRVVPQQQIFF